jgi:rare lipoprotein A
MFARGIFLILALSVAGCATQFPPARERPTFTQTGLASWYGAAHHGKRTAQGERFDMNGLTAAHRTLPLDTTVRVTNIENQRTVKVRINDRGPYVRGRIIDLSARAARDLAIGEDGIARVRIAVFPSDQGG